MGAFFTNVQVRAGARSIAPLIDAIREAAGDADEVDADGEPDRTIFVLPADEGGWVALYDEASESQDGVSLDALGRLASRALDAPAFTVTIHDSDILGLGLYVGGERVDRYDSHPGYFGERVSKKQRAAVAGNPSAWAPWLVAGASPEALGAAFASESLFAEGTLASICELIGCDRDRAGTGHRYTVSDGAALPEGTVTLRFRARVRPAHERPLEGPPRFDAHSPYGKQPIALAVGDELRLGVSVKSAGGASTGLSIVAWGSAIDQGLVSVERFEVLIGDVRAGARHEHVVPAREVSTEGATLLVVDRPEQAIAAGSEALGWGPGVDVHRLMEAFARATLHVNVVGRVVKDGKGELSCAFVPHANRVEGAMVGQYALSIDPPLSRPLRAISEDQPGGASHLLRPLLGKRFLTAMVSIDGPRAAAADFGRDAIEDALAVLGIDGQLELAVHHRDAQRRPRVGKGKPKTMLRGKRLDALVASLAEEAMIDLRVFDGPPFDEATGPRSPLWGLSFGASVLGDREDERVPTLALFADTASIGEPKTALLRERWSALVDRAMERGGVQGVLLRSGWTASAYHCPYETACGAPFGIVTARSWVTRWVRVPGNDRLWLGPALAARLDAAARAALSAIATVEDRDGGLRITLASPDAERALELALASLLPTAAEGHEATRAWHARAS